MTYQPDLSEGNRVGSVGYLDQGRQYPQGEVSEAALDRLVKLAVHTPVQWFGYHSCDLDLCIAGGPQPKILYRGTAVPDRCSTDLIVPDEDFLYAAPALIIHYIMRHRYQPPACFLEAALRCPEPDSNEYILAINRVEVPFCQFPLKQKCKNG